MTENALSKSDLIVCAVGHNHNNKWLSDYQYASIMTNNILAVGDEPPPLKLPDKNHGAKTDAGDRNRVRDILTMNKFNARAKSGEEYSHQIFGVIKQMGFDVALNGTEHTHADFVQTLRHSEDVTSFTVRFAPDGVINGGRYKSSAYVEVKNASFIEKTAHENYMRLHKDGCVVIVVAKNRDDGQSYWNHVDAIELQSYKSRRHNWPIDVDGWVCPREHIEWDKKQFGFGGSGTAHKRICFRSMLPLDTFKKMVEDYLSG
jgi:hypothetical protein